MSRQRCHCQTGKVIHQAKVLAAKTYKPEFDYVRSTWSKERTDHLMLTYQTDSSMATLHSYVHTLACVCPPKQTDRQKLESSLQVLHFQASTIRTLTVNIFRMKQFDTSPNEQHSFQTNIFKNENNDTSLQFRMFCCQVYLFSPFS